MLWRPPLDRLEDLEHDGSLVATSVVTTQFFDVTDTLFQEDCGKVVAHRVYYRASVMCPRVRAAAIDRDRHGEL